MSIQSEAALEAGLIATLRQMDYEYVQITEDDNLYANFKRQLEIHNKKQLAEVGRNSFTDEEFEKGSDSSKAGSDKAFRRYIVRITSSNGVNIRKDVYKRQVMTDFICRTAPKRNKRF